MSLQSNGFSIGVEEEYQIIDPHTRELSQAAELIMPAAQELLGDAVQYEMILSQIEIATPICQTLDDVQRELTRLRRGIITAADQRGLKIAAAGTHPFSPWNEQEVTPRERYVALITTYQQLIREQVIFGCHVHIGIPDPENAILILNHARVWLAPLIALTANSPYWLGEDTGYQDYRTGLWWTVPLAGPPPYFTSHDDYRTTINTLIETESIDDATKIYWDLRPSERFPTLEFRVMDVNMTVDEAVVITGLTRALVRTCYEQVVKGIPYPEISSDQLRAMHWRAARYGLDANLFDTLKNCTVPAHQCIENMLTFLRPALEAEGDWERVEKGVRLILREGNGARKQLNIFQKTGDFKDVVDYVVAQTGSF